MRDGSWVACQAAHGNDCQQGLRHAGHAAGAVCGRDAFVSSLMDLHVGTFMLLVSAAAVPYLPGGSGGEGGGL